MMLLVGAKASSEEYICNGAETIIELLARTTRKASLRKLDSFALALHCSR
jgi:hypothetical protein